MNTGTSHLAQNLSYSERCALVAILDELGDGTEGRIVCTRLSRKRGVARGLFVSALAKAGAAGVLRSESCGRMGVHVWLLNRPALQEAVQ